MTTHGHTQRTGKQQRTPTYNSWRAMIERCTYVRHPFYSHYGGRGISVAAEWRGRGGFARFLEHVGVRPEDHTLDRKDVNGHYEPGNVQWATLQQQRWNRTDMCAPIEDVPDEYQVTPLTLLVPKPFEDMPF